MRLNYDIPYGWTFPFLEELAKNEKGSIRIGPFGSALKKHEYSDSGIGVLGIEHVHPNKFVWNTPKYIPLKKYEELTQYTVQSGDVLVTNMGTVGRTCYVPKNIETSIISSHLIKISLNQEICIPKYLCYVLNNSALVTAQIKAKSRGAIMAGFNTSLLKKLKIPLPPLPIQKKIAAILDTADALKQKDKALIAKYNELTQSLFLDMFGDPFTNSKGWEKISLSHLGKITSGSTPSRKNESYFTGEIPWVKTTEVNGSVINGTSEKISDEALQKSSCRLYPKGSIIIAMYGQGKTRGQVGILDIAATTNQACGVIPPSNLMNFGFLFELLKMSYEDLRNLGRGGNQPNLSVGLVKNYAVINPPIELQNKFAERIKIIEQQKQLAAQSLKKSEDLFNCLLQKAFKGELVS